MFKATSRESITAILKAELELSNQLLGILQKEYMALSQNNNAQFLELVENKQTCTEQLQQVEKQLTLFLDQYGYTINKTDIEKCINALPPKNQSAARLTWQSLVNTAQQCKQQNQVNGRTINLARIKTKQALAILSGRETGANIYDQTGKTDDGDNAPSIAIV
ncbi:MAG: flagellar protein FlgN [Gammaproteobacteria bacterium]|nr:flagellar protein FlgN [Gammaproteobacteria bacterium]